MNAKRRFELNEWALKIAQSIEPGTACVIKIGTIGIEAKFGTTFSAFLAQENENVIDFVKVLARKCKMELIPGFQGIVIVQCFLSLQQVIEMILAVREYELCIRSEV